MRVQKIICILHLAGLNCGCQSRTTPAPTSFTVKTATTTPAQSPTTAPTTEPGSAANNAWIDHHFKFSLPDGWVGGRLTEDILVCYPDGEDSELVQVRITVFGTATAGSPADSAENFKRSLGTNCVDLDQQLQVNGTPVRRITFHVPADRNGTSEHFMGWAQYWSDGPRGYAAVFQTTPDKFNRFSDSGKSLLDGIRRTGN